MDDTTITAGEHLARQRLIGSIGVAMGRVLRQELPTCRSPRA